MSSTEADQQVPARTPGQLGAHTQVGQDARTKAQAFHWPCFTETVCGTLNDRERLGLPEHFFADRFRSTLAAQFATLRSVSTDALLHTVSDGVQALERRFAAGALLAMVGDPRIRVDAPEVIYIPGGPVEIGLPVQRLDAELAALQGLGLDPAWIGKECPRHAITLARYGLARFPVTNQEYLAFLQATHYPELPSSWDYRRYPQERANHPVYTLSMTACRAYADWLSNLTGRGFRLPTEAEWEHAAAGPAGLTYPWGEQFDALRANCCETGIFQTSPVGVFCTGASYFGVEDMAGNVEEYVADLYAPYPGGAPVSDHLQQIHGQYHVARGGSFARFRDLARTRRRHGYNPRSATYTMGFRLAETP